MLFNAILLFVTHSDHVALIKSGVEHKSGVWADFGSGEGAFTLALADLLDKVSQIFSVDKNKGALNIQQYEFARRFTGQKVKFVAADFTQNLDLPPLDGILMANSLHYVKNQSAMLEKIKTYLKPQAIFLIVEYNSNAGNMWVPHPVSFEKFTALAKDAGFSNPKLLATIPSQFLQEIYSAKTNLLLT